MLYFLGGVAAGFTLIAYLSKRSTIAIGSVIWWIMCSLYSFSLAVVRDFSDIHFIIGIGCAALAVAIMMEVPYMKIGIDSPKREQQQEKEAETINNATQERTKHDEVMDELKERRASQIQSKIEKDRGW